MNPYGLDVSSAKVQPPLASLNVLYDGMPDTHGCEKCAEINGKGGKDWCCIKQNPSMFYAEFFNVYKEMQDNWTKEKRKQVLFRAIRNYLSNSLQKGCIFYDNGCTIYKQRPFNCRMYGVVPKENWDKRWEALKERQGDKFEAMPQCTLVSADRQISAKDEDKWFAHTRDCEKRIGINEQTIDLYDMSGGSYRTFHDHLLLEMLGEDMMSTLSLMRLENPTEEDIDLTVQKIGEMIDEPTIYS